MNNHKSLSVRRLIRRTRGGGGEGVVVYYRRKDKMCARNTIHIYIRGGKTAKELQATECIYIQAKRKIYINERDRGQKEKADFTYVRVYIYIYQ